MKDRKPLLCDLFLATYKTKNSEFQVVSQKTLNHVADALIQAKRFVLDTGACQYIGEMQRAVPHAICHAQEFAIQPFKTMYIEVDNLAMWQAVNPDRKPDADMDNRIGYLYDDGRVYVIAGNWSSNPGHAMVMPISYGLHRPITVEEELRLCERLGVSRIWLDAFFWGSLWTGLSKDDQRAFRANHSLRMELREGLNEQQVQSAAQAMFQECCGELRNIIALLLFLNRTSQTRVEDHVPHRTTMIGTRPSTMLSHSVVHFSLNPKPLFLESWGTGSAWRKEHDVRGHFCHDKAARAWCSAHDWSEYGVNQWRCMKCGGKKWWRKEHKRGHRDKGTMTTTYEVSA